MLAKSITGLLINLKKLYIPNLYTFPVHRWPFLVLLTAPTINTDTFVIFEHMFPPLVMVELPMVKSQQSWIPSQHPPTRWNLSSGG
jgi:hypothetical protein